MVMQLPQPGACSIQLVHDVVDERQNGVNAAYFEGVRLEWLQRVNIYIQHRGSPEHVPKWNGLPLNRKKSFLNLYLAPDDDSAHGKVLAILRDHKLNLCPSCGEMGKPNTLDHYLPKGLYPQFCITPLNLFPMCDSCQKEKLEKTGTLNEPRFFLHPYFDAFIADQVLSITIEPPFDAPSFTLNVATNITLEQRSVLSAHVRELKIEERFAHFFKEQNMRMLKLVKGLRQAGVPIEPTLRSIEQSHQAPTPNSWEHIYYKGVVDNLDMLEYLSNGQLPSYV